MPQRNKRIKNIKISDDDLDWIRKMMGITIDSKLKKVLTCMESKDIQACPGAGKTTALVAKLAILTRKIPNNFLEGVCVLSHTNVAKDEINDRLDKLGYELNKYPFFVGTIQKFVNQYLALPGLYHFFDLNGSPTIDKDIYQAKAKNYFYEYIDRKIIYGSLKHETNNNNCLAITRYEFADLGEIGKLNRKDRIKKFSFSKSSKSYKQLKKVKDLLTKEGFLTYKDAYCIAYKYLKKFPSIKNVIRKRFPIIFIDEVQDLSYMQEKIISELFNDDENIIQRIGDLDQNIHGSKLDWSPDPEYTISSSRRMSKEIANESNLLSFHFQELDKDITSIDDEKEGLSPIVFTFNDDNIEEVIPHFAEYVFENNKPEDLKNYVKAIGWRQSRKDKLSIDKYWTDYVDLGDSKKTREFSALRDYFTLSKNKIENSNCKLSEIKNLLKKGIIKLLKLSELDREYYGKLEDDLDRFIIQDNFSWSNFRNFIENNLTEKYELNLNSQSKDFFNKDGSIQEIPENEEVNKYNQEFQVQIDTIHSVKGETHYATLVLETFYYDHDLKNYLKLNADRIKIDNVHSKLADKLSTLHVATTRARKVLCFAVKEEHIEKRTKEILRDKGWSIEKVSI